MTSRESSLKSHHGVDHVQNGKLKMLFAPEETTTNLDYTTFFPSLTADLKDPTQNEIHDNRLNRFLKTQDKRGYLNPSYDPYARELNARETEEGKRRMGRFISKYLLTSINEKISILQGQWRKRGNSFENNAEYVLSSEDTDPALLSAQDKLTTEISYRVRTDRSEVVLRNEWLGLTARAYYKGPAELVLSKYFDGVGVDSYYFVRPSNSVGDRFVLQKDLPYNLRAKSGLAKEITKDKEISSSAKVELLFSDTF